MTESVREKRLLERYGELLTAADLAEVFRYSSDSAVRKAHAAGRLPVSLRRFPNRRGLFATVESVAAAISRLEDESEN